MGADKIYEELIASGNEYYDIGDYRSALEKYDEASKISPEEGLAWYLKGMTLSQLGKYNEALMAYDMATRLDPERYEAYLAKGILMYALENVEGGINTLKEAFARKSSAEIACYISIGYVLLRDEERALEWFSKGARINSKETAEFLDVLYEEIVLNNDTLNPDEKLAMKTMIAKFKERILT